MISSDAILRALTRFYERDLRYRISIMSVVYSNERQAGRLRGNGQRKKKKKRTTMTMKNKGRQVIEHKSGHGRRERASEQAIHVYVSRASRRIDRKTPPRARYSLLPVVAEAEDAKRSCIGGSSSHAS